VGDRTGLEMIRTLQDHAVHQGQLDVFMECRALQLLKHGNRVCGALGLWKETGRFVIVRAKAVIMATGGGGRAWRVTSNSWEYSGDGTALAYEAGAELMDMEFTQFHPTGMVWPPSVRGTLVTEGVRGEGGILRNNKGERFMFSYVPEKFAAETADTEEEAARWLAGDKTARRPPELLTRDVVARAIKSEVDAGRGSPHGGAFLDIASQRPAEVIKRKLPSMYHQFKELAEVDITREPMEVGPTLHYFMGGIRVDSDTQQSTTVPGLFACGECGAGLHGANRLGGNSLSDLLVFGRLAGIGACDFAAANPQHPELDADQITSIVRGATDILNRESGENPFLLHEELQELMQNKVGIARLGGEIQEAIDGVAALRERATRLKAHAASQYNAGWHEALDIPSLLVNAEAVARAALLREESRGGHYRIDCEGEREEWSRYNIVIRKGADGTMEIRKNEREAPPEELARIANSKIEDLEAGRV
jgi:succinate dehydrogenase / fumarate reductase flavoprotein subunit